MKRNLLVALSCLSFGVAFSQSVPNGGFESWQVNNYQEPQFYRTANYEEKNNIFLGVVAVKTPDAYHGNWALRLNSTQTGTQVNFAWFADGEPGNGPSGGIPYNQQATGVRFYYKSNIVGTDTAIFLCWFKKLGSYIGQYIIKIPTSANVYTLKDVTFSPALTQAPDSIIIAAASGNAFSNSPMQPGNWLQLDSITLKGVNSQPNLLNGDLEQWQTLSNDKLNGWYTSGQFQRANDAYSGSYALELQTEGPSFGGNGSVYPSSARTGTPTQNNTLGGYPYSLQNDTLVFYYKYLPASPDDSARIDVNLKLNGVGMGGANKKLGIAAAYTRVKIGWSAMSVPDTMILSIESSKNYPCLPEYVGSDLKIDNMYLKSQTIPISNFISPNVGCLGQPVQLTDNSFNMANAWAWIMPGGSPGSSTQQNPIVTYNSVGTKTITMVCSNQFGSGAVVTKTISINTIPNVVAPTIIKPCGLTGTAVLTASGATSYSWSTGATGASIVVSPTVTTNYTVVGIQNGCLNGAIGSVVIPTPPKPSICMVTTDSLNQNNEIFWDKLSYPMLDSMIIYREVITNTFKRIGAKHKSAVSYFSDTTRSVGPANGDPNISTYRYKIQVRDTCGNYGPMSLWHNTVFFTHTGSTFFWTNNYLIEGPINPIITYSLLVCQDPTVSTVYQLVGTTTGNQNQLNDPFYQIYQATADWRVVADLGYSCLAQKVVPGNKTAQVSRSNIANNRAAVGLKENSLLTGVKVFPNPVQKILNVNIDHATSETELKLFNMIGEVVYSAKISGNKTSIDVSSFSKGIYTLAVSNASGKAMHKIVVE
jgi:PKD repeat protein